MKRKLIYILLFCGIWTWSFALLAKWEDQIAKHDDGLYSAKIVGRPLTLIMEKIDDHNLKLWRHYARIQNNPRAIQFLMQQFPKFTNDGSRHFMDVLFDVDHNKNEIWVAYITSNDIPRHITEEDTADYSVSEAKTKTGFFENIVMYVTVVSTPDALITSHMGVSASHEGLRKNIRGVSKDLHSFGAKVMLLRNPGRKYMVNAPAVVMESILASALARGSFFAGNKELLPILERKVKETEGQIAAALAEKGGIKQKLLSAAEIRQELVQSRLKKLESRFEAKEINEQEYSAIKSDMLDAEYLSKDFLAEKDQNIVIASDAIEKEAQRRLELEYGLNRIKPGLELIRSFGPQIISVDGPDGKTAKNIMKILEKDDPQAVWLIIKKGDQNYDWIFTEPFEPAGNTHYIAADLKTLANISEIESSKK